MEPTAKNYRAQKKLSRHFLTVYAFTVHRHTHTSPPNQVYYCQMSTITGEWGDRKVDAKYPRSKTFRPAPTRGWSDQK